MKVLETMVWKSQEFSKNVFLPWAVSRKLLVERMNLWISHFENYLSGSKQFLKNHTLGRRNKSIEVFCDCNDPIDNPYSAFLTKTVQRFLKQNFENICSLKVGTCISSKKIIALSMVFSKTCKI